MLFKGRFPKRWAPKINHSLGLVFQLSESDKAPVVTDSTKTVITPSAVDEQQTVESASVDSSIKSSQVIYHSA